jgi:hypothetical protein
MFFTIEMDTVVLQEEEEIDDTTIEELCEALHKSSQQIAELYNDTYIQFRGMKKKVKEEMNSMDKQALKPKAHAKKWIAAHDLPETPTFYEFFEKVCDDLAKEQRLDLATRTLVPTKEIAKLFRVKENEPIHILDFIMQAPEIFH